MISLISKICVFNKPIIYFNVWRTYAKPVSSLQLFLPNIFSSIVFFYEMIGGRCIRNQEKEIGRKSWYRSGKNSNADWLWKINIDGPLKLEEMDPDTKQYWRKVRKMGLWRNNKLSKLKKF